MLRKGEAKIEHLCFVQITPVIPVELLNSMPFQQPVCPTLGIGRREKIYETCMRQIQQNVKHDEGELSEKYEEDGSQGCPLDLH